MREQPVLAEICEPGDFRAEVTVTLAGGRRLSQTKELILDVAASNLGMVVCSHGWAEARIQYSEDAVLIRIDAAGEPAFWAEAIVRGDE